VQHALNTSFHTFSPSFLRLTSTQISGVKADRREL
jgi:hypothetical protein